MLKCLQVSEKSSTFAASKVNDIAIMAQETLDSLIQVMFTLSLPEQVKVITRMQENVKKLSHQSEDPFTMEEINARMDASERDMAEGRVSPFETLFYPKSVAI